MISDFKNRCKNNSKFFSTFYVFFFSTIEMSFTRGKKKRQKRYLNMKQNFELFLHMLLKFQIMRMRFGQVIRL